MLALDSGDKIQGDASIAAKIDYSLHGLDNNAIKQLADGQLADATGDLYTADSVDVVATIILCNTHTSALTCNLFILPSAGTARRLIPKDMSLAAGNSLHTDGKGVVIMSAVGGTVTAYGAHQTTHSPNDGSDALDCAAPAELAGIQAAAEGTADTLARADHAHQIQESMADNHIVTVNDADAATNDMARFTSTGGLEGRSAQEVLTSLLALTLLENESIKLDAVLSADGKYTGITRVGTAGAILAVGDVVYYAVADGKWELADADAAATGSGAIGICVLAAAEDAATNILLIGLVRAATFPALTAGAPVFLSCTAGDLASAVPAKATGDIVRCLGQAWTAEDLWFAPSPDWYEYA